MAGALPKVTEYVKNLGKSVAYSATDYMKNVSPKASEFLDTNADLFKDIYHGVVDYKNTLKNVDKSIKGSKVYEAANEGKKALFEDLKSGKFYNPERMGAFDLKAGGFEDLMNDDWGSMGFDDDFGDMDDFDDDTDASDVQSKNMIKATVKSNDILGKKLGAALDESTKANVRVNIRTAAMLSDTIKGSTSAIVGHQQRIYESMTGGMLGIRQDMARLTGFFIKGPMENHLNNSTTFYDVTTKNLNEMNAMLKELLEMQRNMYKVAQTNKKDPYNDIVGSEGTPDLKEYAKNVKKNLKDALGPQFDMVFGNGMGDGNLLLAFVSSPLKFLPDMLVRTVIPSMLKNTIEVFDDSLGTIFSNAMAKLNKMTDADNPFLAAIGRVFGIKIGNKTSVDTSRYKKDAVPFDGITRKAITEVIPGYLARIESALTNSNNDRVYDYDRGKWTTIKEVEKNYKKSVDYYKNQPMDEMLDKFNEYITELKKSNAAQAEALSQSMKMIARRVYDDGGVFEPYRVQNRGSDDEEDPWDYYGIDENDFKTIVKLIMPNKSNKNDPALRKAAMHLAERVFDARDSMSRMHEKAEEGYSPITQLFNNAFPNIKASNVALSEYSNPTNMINSSVDKYNKNIFDYLRGIYAELIGIGEQGSIKRGRRPRRDTVSMTGDPLRRLESRLQSEKDAVDNAVKAANNLTDTGVNLDPDNFFLDEERKRLQDEDDKKKDEEFFKDLLGAKTVGDKYKAFKSHFDRLAQKPAMAVAGLFDKADKRLYKLIFGDEDKKYTDKRGNDVNGILNYIIMRTEETFDKLNEWFRKQFNRFSDWFKQTELYKQLNKGWNWAKEKAKPVGEALKRKFGWAKSQVKSSLSNTYGASFDELFGRGAERRRFEQLVTSGDEEAIAAYYENLANNPTYNYSRTGAIEGVARGKFFTKRGLAIVSPGEMVIPATFDRRGQGRQLAREKAYANRFGIKNAKFFAQGNAALDSSTGFAQSVPVSANNIIQFPQKDQSKVESTIKNVMKEISPNAPDVIADGLIGGGVSLITGMIGGPLLGAAVGAAYGIAKNSNTVQKWLFGEDVVGEDGKTVHKGGIMSKETQEKLKKYLPDMKDFGIAGAVTGLFTPFGILGGAMLGSAVGYLKNNKSFQNWLFGEEDKDNGVISKKFANTVKKGAPRMAVGAIGGILFGPGGFLVNAALGSALGLISSTDSFHDFIFGKDDGHGNRTGGLTGAVKQGIVDPLREYGKKFIKNLKEFGSKKILEPLKNFVRPFGQMVKNAVSDVANTAKDFVTNMLDKTIGRPLADFFQHSILEPTGRFMRKILKAPLALFKGIISAPFALLGGIGNNIRSTQIRKGSANDMTAADRLKWRQDHPFRMGSTDKYKKTDAVLANSDSKTLQDMKDAVKSFMSLSRKLPSEAVRQIKQAGDIISSYLNNTRGEDGNGSLYQRICNKDYGFRCKWKVKDLHEAVADGDARMVQNIVRNWQEMGAINPDQAGELFAKIMPIVQQIKTIRDNQGAQGDVIANARKRLYKLTGGAVDLDSNSSMRRFLGNLNTETDLRKLQELKGQTTEEKRYTEEEKYRKNIDERTADIVGLLRNINTSLRILGGAATEEEKSAYFDISKKKDVTEFADEIEYDEEGNPVGINTSAVVENSRKYSGRSKFLAKMRNGGRGLINRVSSMKNTISDKFRDTVYNTRSNVLGMRDKAINGAKNAVFDIGNRAAMTGERPSGMSDAEVRADIKAGGLEKYKIPDSNAIVYLDKNGKPKYGAVSEYKKWKSEGHQDNELKNIFFKGMVGKGKGKSALDFIKKAPMGLINIIGGGINKITDGPIGKFAKFVLGGAFLVAASGHLAEFWTNTAWPAIKSVATKIGEFISPIAEDIKTKLAEAFPSIFGEDGAVATAMTKLKEFVTDPFGKLGEWFTSGWKKAWEYIAQPAFTWLKDKVFPTMSAFIWNAIHNKNWNDFTKSVGYKEVSSVTTASGEEVTVETTNYDNGIADRITGANVDGTGWNLVQDVEKIATVYGHKYRYIQYIPRIGGKKIACIVVRNEDTGEYIRIDGNLSNVKKVTYGITTDATGELPNGAIFASMAVGLGAAIAGAAKGAAIAGAAGTVVPGIGNAIGVVTGAIAGAVLGFVSAKNVSNTIYKLSGGGYASEIYLTMKDHSIQIAQVLAAFGFDGKSDWPVVDNTGGVSINNQEFRVRQSMGDNVDSVLSQGNKTYDAIMREYNANNPASSYLYGNGRRFSLRKPSGRGHVYQNSPWLANMPFGNSTIGEAGCGPVTATNMINRLSGTGMDVGTAASFAERGGYIDSTGGTTTNYISDILRSSGYSAKETKDRSSIASALRAGQSAVLLGKSGSNDLSTPFGGSNHYINAYGMDGRGNVITEDPDLPNGMRKYPMSRLMKDTQVGIVTGRARGRQFGGKRRSGKEKTITVSNLARAIYQVIQQVEAGGRYDAVNASDSKTFSIGKIQWNAGAGNAKPIILKIMSALGNQNPGISSTVWTALQGDDIYKRHLTGTEAAEIKKLLATDASKEVQDAEAILRIENYYIPTAKKLGITDNKAIAYFCDSYNIGPVAASNIVKNMGGSISLDSLHEATRTSQTFGQNSQYWSRKVKVYELCKSLGSLSGSSTISVSELTSMVQADEDTNGGFLSKFTSAVSMSLKALYGDLFDQMFGSTSSIGGSVGGSNLIDKLDPNSTPDPRQAQLVNKMASIEGQIKYGLGATQDPDKGEASCASTVAWAYNKVLGFKPGGASFAGSTSQAKDSRFTTIWTNDGSGDLPVEKLQPGDILYQNWDQTANNGSMHHTEMYVGNGVDLSHGGNPKYGPVKKQLNDYRKKHTMMVRRYTPFLETQQLGNMGSKKNLLDTFSTRDLSSRSHLAASEAKIEATSGRSRNGVAAMHRANMRRMTSNPAHDASMKYIDSVRSGMSRQHYSGTANASNVSYEEFLMTIVNVLLTIANNTSTLDKILEILLKNGIKIDKMDIQNASGSSRSAKQQIRQIVDSANRAAGKARNAGTAVEKATELMGGESTAMIVQIMEALASK